MSMFLEDSMGNLVSFSDFCLSESIRPKPTQYGTDRDMSDGNIERKGNTHYTFMKAEDSYWRVVIFNNEVGFGRSEKYSLDPSDYNTDRRDTRSALKIFNRVFYVLLEMFDKIRDNTMTVIKFDSAHPALGRVYDRMVKNKWFLESMSERDFEYIGLDKDGKHTFRTRYGKGFSSR